MNNVAIKVLVVDDELDFLETIVKRLERRGFLAIGVSSGRAALDYLESHSVDVVILDVRMPGIDGIDVLKEIVTKWPTTQVILLTGHGSIEAGMKGLELGAYDYVLKPAKLEDIIKKINQAYERKLILEKE
ncbi:MAG: response regulator [Syntrophobacterales bacterium]|nr:response regulator [Syntrophobacterales bacterium]